MPRRHTASTWPKEDRYAKEQMNADENEGSPAAKSPSDVAIMARLVSSTNASARPSTAAERTCRERSVEPMASVCAARPAERLEAPANCTVSARPRRPSSTYALMEPAASRDALLAFPHSLDETMGMTAPSTR